MPENYSTHPIAESIREAYRERKCSLAEAETQKANAGTAEIVLDADNDTIKEVQSKEGVQGVVRKPLIDLTRIGETNRDFRSWYRDNDRRSHSSGG